MDFDYKIKIPKPCFENWEAMTPNTLGKFCGSCQKNVVDFTSKSTVEIQNYLIENKEKRVCGRFEASQLSSITIQIPQQVLLNQVHFHKMFLLALLIAMGTTLLSCADNEGKKQTIEKVEIVEEELNDSSQTTIGMLIPNDSIIKGKVVAPPEPTPKENEVKFKKPHPVITTTGIIELHPKDSLKKPEN